MIQFSDVTIRRDGRVLFSGASFQLHKPQKIGVIGNNGVGKSTLFATIIGEMASDVGTVAVPDAWQVAHMAQEVVASDETALDYVLSGDEEWFEIYQKIHHENGLAQNEIGHNGMSDDEIAKLHQRFDEIDGYRTKAKAAIVLSGLGFGEHEHQKAVKSFSGGWRMRLNLARTLMKRADVLLLDEPTNHLDLDAILWLEEWLIKFDGLILLISHDQAFLDTVVDRILHIEQGKITLYTGNYSQFVKIRAERLAQEQQAFEKQQATKAHLENFIRRFRAKASKAKQAQSRIKQLEKMSDLAPVMAVSGTDFAFYEPDGLSSPLMVLENAAAGYQDTPIVSKVNLQITPETRLGILGANGAGKSTLIKALVGELPLMAGKRAVSENLKLGYFNQHQMDSLDGDATPMILLRRLAGATSDALLRSFLGSFDFRGDRIDTSVHSFSGGEKARLTLALIVWQRPNVLILDEPTNHLDLQMRNALMLALQNFTGALILVSHDRDLMMNVCDSLMLVADGRADEFTGDMTDYANHLKQARQARQLANKSFEKDSPKNSLKNSNDKTITADKLSKEEQRKKNAEIRQKTAPLRKAIENLEKNLASLSDKLKAIEDKLSDNALYDDVNKEMLMTLLNEQSQLKAQTDEHEENLLIKMDELERLELSLSDG